MINFSPANTVEDHIHRFGRTGRAGKKGYAITIIDKDNWETAKIMDIVKVMKKSGQVVDQELEAMAKECRVGGYGR